MAYTIGLISATLKWNMNASSDNEVPSSSLDSVENKDVCKTELLTLSSFPLQIVLSAQPLLKNTGMEYVYNTGVPRSATEIKKQRVVFLRRITTLNDTCLWKGKKQDEEVNALNFLPKLQVNGKMHYQVSFNKKSCLKY